jgi:hypothetical protein
MNNTHQSILEISLMANKRIELSNVKADEDFQTWRMYPKYRNLFNKLEIALSQGLHAAPAAVNPLYEGYYISRPIYNFYGMGIGAKKFWYSEDMYNKMLNNDIVPPGHFWCEWIQGDHISVDFHRNPKSGIFYTRSTWQGKHYSSDNLTRFSSWTRLENKLHPYDIKLNLPWNDEKVTAINLEIKGSYIIEAHLRLGNDVWDDLPIGTEVIPIWQDMEPDDDSEFRGNLHSDMEKYSASGYLTDIRKGYIIKRP